MLLPPANEALARRYGECLAGNSAGIVTRPEEPTDLGFLQRLYAGTRVEEMALLDWPEAVKRGFLEDQAAAQIRHYRKHYPDAAFLVCLRDVVPFGRVYLMPGKEELRLMDIAILPAYRRLGLGRKLMAGVVHMAREDGLAVGLHVELNNPVCNWYEQLGFERIEEVGVYWFMRLPARALARAQEKLIS